MSEQKEREEEEPAVEREQVDGAVNTEVDSDGTDPVHKQEEEQECGVNGQTIFPRSGQGWEEAVSQTNIHPQDSEGGHSPKKTSSAYVGNSTATVKIILVPEGQVMTMAFAIGLSIEELKSHFAEELKVPAEVLHVSWNGNVVEDHMTLMDLGVQPNGTTQLELSSTDPLNHPVRPAKPQQDYNMPDVITVRVQQDAELSEFQEVVVEIERATQRKAFLGGYRHTVTGTEYHHAAVQTAAKRRPDGGVAVFSRDTQTAVVKTQAQQCSHSVSTQMTGIGCYVSCVKDKLLTPTGTYVTAAQLHSHRLDAVITLQTYVRRWLARCCVEELMRARDRRLAWIHLEQRRREEEMEERGRAEDRRRRNPRSKEDFALLYNALEKWRQEELQLINSSLCGAERKAALCSLLEQETQLISSIGRHRLLAQHNNYDKAVHAFLDKCAAPRRWCALDGQVTHMDTPSTLRAKALRDLYTSLALASCSQEERLDALLTLKHNVKEHDCKLTRDMVELIDREADLMMRGVKKSSLEGLRKRISTLFLQYIKTPTFNPEVARWLKVPQEDPSSGPLKEKKRYYCHGCRRYLPSGHFSLTATARRVAAGQCRQCGELDNEARQRQDFSKYHAVLERLRHDEERELSTDTSITYLLQEKDMHHLVDVVWGCQSALCACRDLHELLMVRWERRRHWSPWNCILLTKDEAAAHRQVDRVSQAYGSALVQSVEHKHTVAKRYFAQIPAMARYLRSVESQPVARGNQPVSMPVTTETD